MRVLIVEDHRELAAAIATGLRREGMAVDIVFDGEAALAHTKRESYEVVVLDRDLPKVHGDDVCRALVAGGSGVHILMLTAADAIEDRVEGLGLGADDYLPKPFAFAELVGLASAPLRAAAGRLWRPILVCGDIRVDPAQRTATRGRRLELSPRRRSPCWRRCSPPGRALTAEELLARVSDESRIPSATSSR